MRSFLPGFRADAPWVAMARNLVVLWVGQVVTKVIVFVGLAALARRLSPDGYGAAEFALGLSAFAWLIIEGGFGSAGVRRLKQDVDTPAEVAAIVPTGQMLLALLTAPAMLLYAWFAIDDRAVFHLTLWMAASVLLLPFKQDWLFQATGRFDNVVVSQVLRVSLFATMILLFARGDGHFWVVGLAEFTGVAGATAYLAYYQRKLIAPLGLRLSWPEISGLIREGAPIGAGAVCWAATQFVPLFAIGTMAGMTQTAYFGAAHRLGVSLIAFSWLYHFNLFPTLAGQHGIARRFDTQMVRASVRLTAWTGVAVALGLSLAAERLLPLLFGPAFVKSAGMFSIIVWTFPLTLVSGHARWLLVASKRSGEMLISQIAGVAAAIAACVALIPSFGSIGAAIGMFAASLAVWVASQILAARKGTPVPWKPCILPAACAAAILLMARQTTFDPWIEAVAGVAVLGAVALIFDPALRDIARALMHGHLQQGSIINDGGGNDGA